MSALIWIIGAFLLFVGIIDYKFRAIPSILLTGFLFAVMFLTTYASQTSLVIGLLGLTMALLMYEGNFIGGIADIKIMAMVSFMIVNPVWLMFSFILIGIFGITWKSIIKIKYKEDKEFAFIPVFFFVYISLVLLGGIA